MHIILNQAANHLQEYISFDYAIVQKIGNTLPSGPDDAFSEKGFEVLRE
jgi:hypothetical protein